MDIKKLFAIKLHWTGALRIILSVALVINYILIFKNREILKDLNREPYFFFDYSELFLMGSIVSSIFLFLGLFNRLNFIVLVLLNIIFINSHHLLYQVQYSVLNLTLLTLALFLEEPFINKKIHFSSLEFHNEKVKKTLHLLFSYMFFISGLSKVQFELWTDGVALARVCNNALFNLWTDSYCSWPSIYFTSITYLALVIELMSVLAFWEKIRHYIYLSQFLILAGIIIYGQHYNIFFPLLFSLCMLKNTDWTFWPLPKLGHFFKNPDRIVPTKTK